MISNVYDGEVHVEVDDRIFRARLPYTAPVNSPSAHILPVHPLLVVGELVGAVIWDALNTPLKVLRAIREDDDMARLDVIPCTQQEVNDLIERDRRPREFQSIDLEVPLKIGPPWWERL